MIKPTIGRSLHFFANSESDLKLFGSRGPFACILCGVINDTTINVGVFTNEGTVVGRTGVHLLHGEVIGGDVGSYCAWMPFQQGQAARTDSAEKVLFEQLASALERIAQLEALTGNIGAQRGDINQLRAGSTQRLEEAFADHQASLRRAKEEYEQEKGQRGLPDEKTPTFEHKEVGYGGRKDEPSLTEADIKNLSAE